MPLVTSTELLAAAEAGNYGVGAFNAINMESAQAIFKAAEEERAPFILQVTQTTLGYTEPEELVALIKELAKKSTVPMALHLDHGRSFEKVMQFLAMGFTSVMIDGSLTEDGQGPRSWDENVEVTCKVVEAAHAIGVPVEGEFGMLGQIGGDLKGGEGALTDPDLAAKFVETTGIDILAVGVGTTHGLFKGKPYIDHERLKQIDAKVKVPLVMHGGTGVPDEDVRQGITEGIRKINFDTGIRVSFIEAVAGEIHAIEKEWTMRTRAAACASTTSAESSSLPAPRWLTRCATGCGSFPLAARRISAAHVRRRPTPRRQPSAPAKPKSPKSWSRSGLWRKSTSVRPGRSPGRAACFLGGGAGQCPRPAGNVARSGTLWTEGIF